MEDSLTKGLEQEFQNDPDYIGIYKNDEGQTAIEFIKKAYTNLLLGVEVDEEKQYIYVTTMYPITDRKIENRIYSGKLINIKKK